jgi:hypothetical protein
MALDLVDWSPLMKQIGGLGDTLAENRLLQNRASRGKLVQSGNYNQAAQAAFADGAIDEATQYQGLQRQHDQDAWTRRRAERQDARDAASTALTNQLTGLKIKEAEDDLGAKLKTRVAGIAQTILAETDPQKRAGMWSRFVGADKRIGDGLREYGVDPGDVETGAKYLIAEAGGSATAKPIEVNGRLVQRMGDGSYKEVYSSPPKPAQLMASDRKEVYESDEAVRAGTQALGTLDKAVALNSGAYSGVAPATRAWLGSQFGIQSSEDTRELDNIVTRLALEQLKLTFGGSPTEGEREILVKVQGSLGETPEVRKRIFETAKEAVNQRVAFNREQGQAIRSGQYFTPGYDPNAAAAAPREATPPQTAPVKVNSIEEARKLAPGTIFIDPNGEERVR